MSAAVKEHNDAFNIAFCRNGVAATSRSLRLRVDLRNGTFSLNSLPDDCPVLQEAGAEGCTAAGWHSSRQSTGKDYQCQVSEINTKWGLAKDLLVMPDPNSDKTTIGIVFRFLEMQDAFLVRCVIANAGEHSARVGRLIPLQTSKPIFDNGDQLNAALRVAYCGAHTGHTSSRSWVETKPGKGFSSWWISALKQSQGSNVLVCGFVTFDRFLGAIHLEETGLLAFNPTENRYLSPNGSLSSEWLFIGCSEDYTGLLEKYADLVAVTPPAPKKSVPVGWASWAHYGPDIREEDIKANLSEIVGKPEVFRGLTIIQIDDGWQESVAHRRPETTWMPGAGFPHDLGRVVQAIHEAGLKAGLWIAPFVVNQNSFLLREHPEYLVRRPDGSLLQLGTGAYVLDPTHPGAQNWIRRIFRRITHGWGKGFRGWGFDYIKMDYLRCLVSSEPTDQGDTLDTERVFAAPVTRTEAYRVGLQIIRDSVGEDVFLLGCGDPVGPSTCKVLDAHRIGQDINPAWDNGHSGIRECTRNIACNFFWHNRVWTNDPDYLILSDDKNESEFWATAVALSGGSVILGNNLKKLEDWQRRIIQRILPPFGQAARPIDLLDGPYPQKWLLHVCSSVESWYIAALFNFMDAPQRITLESQRMEWENETAVHVWDFWREEYLGVMKGEFTFNVPGRSVQLLSLRRDRGVPQIIGTNVHYTQGACELLEVEQNHNMLTWKAPPYMPGKVFVYLPSSYRLTFITDGRQVEHISGIKSSIIPVIVPLSSDVCQIKLRLERLNMKKS